MSFVIAADALEDFSQKLHVVDNYLEVIEGIKL